MNTPRASEYPVSFKIPAPTTVKGNYNILLPIY